MESQPMAWRIGIDEAGYGPNLGPLVMTAVACRVPDDLAEADLWLALGSAVCRKRPVQDRILVNDSKEVFSTSRGLGDLEATVLTILSAARSAPVNDIRCLLEYLCPTAEAELLQEIWFRGDTSLPLAAEGDAIAAHVEKLLGACQAQHLQWGPLRTVVVCPSRFNDMVDREDSKAAVLAAALIELMRWHLTQNGGEAVHVVVDKHGGRNRYAGLVQEMASAGMPLIREEGALCSMYDVAGLDHPLRLTFRPRADSGDLCVALASMISKYLRELFMAEFNEFWQKEVPGVTPTAGYPVDAGRFFADIGPARLRLGVPDRQLWRQR